MKAYLVASKTNQGSTFRLIKHAVDVASIGNKVLFVTTELSVHHITERLHGYINGTQTNTEALDITVRQAKTLDFIEAGEEFDVVVIDSPYLLFRGESSPIIPYEKLFDVIEDALLIMNAQVTRTGYEHGCVQVASFIKLPKWVVSATYLEKIGAMYVETTIDLITGTKADIASVFVIKKAPMMEIPYLTKAV